MDKIFNNSIFLKGALLIYWVVLTFLLFKPAQVKNEDWFLFENIDKVVHLSVFALLAFLFMVAFPRIKFYFFIQIMLLYALLTEILQEEMHAGRSMEILDVVADMTGVSLGFLIYKYISKKTAFFNS